MKRIVFTLVVICALFANESVGAGIYWVFLKDKEGSEPINLSARRIERDLKSGISSDSWYDLKVSPVYVRKLREFPVKIRHFSRWLNAVSVECGEEVLEKIKTLDFVRDIRPVMVVRKKRVEYQYVARSLHDDYYGFSYNQLAMTNLPALHEKGLTGRGVLIVILDTGFRKTHGTFSSILDEGRLIAERDFVWHDDETGDEFPGDTTSEGVQQSHGTAVWSIIGGKSPGELIGAAWGADFALAKTEKLGSETTVEMDNWGAAVEWADSLGADIITSSLAYREFDDFMYTYNDLDGVTTPVARIAAMAAAKGICVVNSMGNEGPESGSLWSPADSRGVLSIGAVDLKGNVAYFSSRGPTADGRIKPDVCTLGIGVYHAGHRSDDDFSFGSGTSFSTPLIAGGIALIKEKHPDWAPEYIYEKVREAGSRADNPDNDYGWGVPDFLKVLRSKFRSEIQVDVYPNPAKKYVNFFITTSGASPAIYTKVRIYSITGKFVTEIPVRVNTHFIRNWDLETFPEKIASGVYLFRVDIGESHTSGKFTILR